MECTCGDNCLHIKTREVEDRDNSRYEENWKSSVSFHTQKPSSFYNLMYTMSEEYSSRSVQIYNGTSSYSYKPKLDNSDIIKSQKYISKHDFKLFIHTPNILNISSEKNLEGVKDRLKTDLYISTLLNSTSILHCGSGDINVGKDTIQSINDILHSTSNPFPLLLENAAEIKGKKTSKKNGGTLQELAYLLSGTDKVGVCIDTQHLFSQGEYNIKKVKEVDRFFKDFDKKIGSDKLRLIHLNDSEVNFGHGRDAHGNIDVGEGFIWEKHTDSLQRILQYSYNRSIPVILESLHDTSILYQVRDIL